MPQTSETAFETVIETHLLDHGYPSISPTGFDSARAIFPQTVLDFIRETQPKEWAKLEALHGNKTGEQILADLCKWMDANGSLATLRHGFKCYGRTLRVAFFKAAHELNPELEARYAANRLGITRQLHFSSRSDKSVDVTLSLNGIPVATAELKNPFTGQTVDDALKQYRQDRDPREPIFEFKQALLDQANLWKADLSGAQLWKANLRETHLNSADLSGGISVARIYLVGRLARPLPFSTTNGHSEWQKGQRFVRPRPPEGATHPATTWKPLRGCSSARVRPSGPFTWQADPFREAPRRPKAGVGQGRPGVG